MLKFFFALITWFNSAEPETVLPPLEPLPWEQSAVFELPNFERDSLAQPTVDNYLTRLTGKNFNRDLQGIWVQSGWDVSASNLGKIPLPAASLTKIATTLAAVDKWGIEHQFPTDIYTSGEIVGGVLEGDLILRGTGDPLFVWEEAIALGNALHRQGIEQIRGDILVADFYMNFEEQPHKAGELFQQAIDYQRWHSEVTQQYLQMPVGTEQPKVETIGEVKQIDRLPQEAKLIIRHRSLPLGEILRQMNIYSNNKMAQMLADAVGGADAVARSSAEIAGFPLEEIELINGSGLGEANRISPRAVCRMLMAIDRLSSSSYNAAVLFPTAGKDLVGTVQNRGLPPGTTIKTGTLDNVSALAGVIPRKERSPVYFSIINYGRPVEYFRQQQDSLLNELAQTWQLTPSNSYLAQKPQWYLGNPQRNKLY